MYNSSFCLCVYAYHDGIEDVFSQTNPLYNKPSRTFMKQTQWDIFTGKARERNIQNKLQTHLSKIRSQPNKHSSSTRPCLLLSSLSLYRYSIIQHQYIRSIAFDLILASFIANRLTAHYDNKSSALCCKGSLNEWNCWPNYDMNFWVL